MFGFLGFPSYDKSDVRGIPYVTISCGKVKKGFREVEEASEKVGKPLDKLKKLN